MHLQKSRCNLERPQNTTLNIKESFHFYSLFLYVFFCIAQNRKMEGKKRGCKKKWKSPQPTWLNVEVKTTAISMYSIHIIYGIWDVYILFNATHIGKPHTNNRRPTEPEAHTISQHKRVPLSAGPIRICFCLCLPSK